MTRYVSMSISMPPEMADSIDEEAAKYGMKAAPYVRQVLREHEGTPFSCDGEVICVDENERPAEDEKTGAA